MASIIIFTDENLANEISNRFLTHKGNHYNIKRGNGNRKKKSTKSIPDDIAYTKPIKKHNENKWFVQILDAHIKYLTANEFTSLQDLPVDWFPLEE